AVSHITPDLPESMRREDISHLAVDVLLHVKAFSFSREVARDIVRAGVPVRSDHNQLSSFSEVAVIIIQQGRDIIQMQVFENLVAVDDIDRAWLLVHVHAVEDLKLEI